MNLFPLSFSSSDPFFGSPIDQKQLAAKYSLKRHTLSVWSTWTTLSTVCQSNEGTHNLFYDIALVEQRGSKLLLSFWHTSTTGRVVPLETKVRLKITLSINQTTLLLLSLSLASKIFVSLFFLFSSKVCAQKTSLHIMCLDIRVYTHSLKGLPMSNLSKTRYISYGPDHDLEVIANYIHRQWKGRWPTRSSFFYSINQKKCF